jgi:hypothetical protein
MTLFLNPTTARLKEMLSGTILKTWATVTLFFLTMLYKDGNLFIISWLATQGSSQNLV